MKFINKIMIINSLIGSLGVAAIEESSPKNYSLKKLSAQRETCFASPDFIAEEVTISLVQALLQSEKEFWNQSRHEMLASNKKLAVIVSILNKRENKLNLEFRLKLFGGEERKKDLDAYIAYQNIVEVIKILDNIEGSIMMAGVNSSSIDETLNSFITAVKKEAIVHENKRHLHTHSNNSIINKQLKHSRYEIHNYKNLEIITSGFAGMLIKILQDHSKTVNLQKAASLKKINKVVSSSKKCRAKNSGYLSTPQEEKISQQDIDALTNYIPEAKGEEELFDIILEAPANATDTVASPNLKGTEKENITSQSSESPEDEGTEKASDNNIEEEYDLEPWKKYQNKSAKLEVEALDSVVDRSQPQLAIQLKLKDEHWMTINTLLKRDKNTIRANVSMKDFIGVIDQMEGNIIRGSKNVHFAIPNIFSGKIVAVSMHALHGDRAEILPRSTYYWDRAVKLLEDAGFPEYLQQEK